MVSVADPGEGQKRWPPNVVAYISSLQYTGVSLTPKWCHYEYVVNSADVILWKYIGYVPRCLYCGTRLDGSLVIIYQIPPMAPSMVAPIRSQARPN